MRLWLTSCNIDAGQLLPSPVAVSTKMLVDRTGNTLPIDNVNTRELMCYYHRGVFNPEFLHDAAENIYNGMQQVIGTGTGVEQYNIVQSVNESKNILRSCLTEHFVDDECSPFSIRNGCSTTNSK